ncbi:MAG TPA: DUF4118 domain-containing protein [Burkholderiales bacterium]|nr:DUF4118 domain-containing protein [Burkholderiales bacterium]
MLIASRSSSVFVSYLGSALAVAIAGLVASAVSRLAPLPHPTVLLLGAVLFSAVRWGFGPSLFAALLSVGVSSFFFNEPIYSFEVHRPQDIVDLVVFVVVSVLTSSLAARIRQQTREVEAREARLRHLHAFSHSLAKVLDFGQLVQTLVAYYSTLLGRRTILPLRSPTGFRLISEPNQKVQLTDDELQTAARWWEGGTAQDRTQCQIGAWTFHRLVRPRGTVGLLGVETLAQSSTASESKQTIELLLEQAAVMIERAAPTGDQKLSGHSSRDNMVSGESS